jgi:signal transduction histidine kinase/Flp pilus assembly CpaE family ATPase
MGDTIRALLVEDNEGDWKLLSAIASEVEDTRIEICHVSRLSDAVDRLAGERFDVILLDLNLPDAKGLNTVTQTRRAAPDVAILVLTGLDDEATGTQALKSGAQDYLVKGRFDGAHLIHAIRYARARNEGLALKPGAAPNQVIGFLGAKGGCGVTTIACHVGAEIGRQTGGKTLVADFDLVTGMIGFLMKATSQYSVLDAVDALDGLDMSSWRSIVSDHGPNLDTLSAPVTLAGRMLPRPERLAQLLKFARLNYSWTLVDLGRGLSEFSMCLLDHLDTSYLVTTPDALALARTKQIIQCLQKSSYPQDRIHIVVNRMTRMPQVKIQDIEQVFKVPVAWILPDDSEMLAAAYLRGTLVQNRSALGETFTRFAARLAGIQEPKATRRWFSLSARRPAEEAAMACGPAESSAGENGGGRPRIAPGEQLRAVLGGPSAGLESAPPQSNQALADARAELQQFAHMAGHDLREPARLIAGYVQLLAQHSNGKLGAEGGDLVASALEGVAQMQERIDGLIEYTRVTTGGAEFQPTSCEEELAAAIAGLRKSIDDTAAVITHDRLPTILADAAQIRKVFHNLISNALTFRSLDVPGVHVQSEEGKSEWKFAVRDNGVGLDPQYGNRIFLLFERLYTRTERPGAGVGLAVAKKIVARHGGRIWVESEPGKGATFHFTIPKQGSAVGGPTSGLEGEGQ